MTVKTIRTANGTKVKTIRKATGDPVAVHVSAKEGEPSTFWKSASGKYYRTKNEAIKDTGKNTVNPSDYEIQVSFVVKYKNYIIGAVVAALVAAALFYFVPKVVAKMKK